MLHWSDWSIPEIKTRYGMYDNTKIGRPFVRAQTMQPISEYNEVMGKMRYCLNPLPYGVETRNFGRTTCVDYMENISYDRTTDKMNGRE